MPDPTLRIDITRYTASSVASAAPRPPATTNHFASMKPTFCSGSPWRDVTSSGRSSARYTILPTGLSTNEITCLIVDDHEVVREGLRLSLSRAPHIRVIGEAGDGEAAVALAERRRPDVVIMDVRMPDMDGLEATKALLKKVPDSSVLIFTAYSERSLLSR